MPARKCAHSGVWIAAALTCDAGISLLQGNVAFTNLSRNGKITPPLFKRDIVLDSLLQTVDIVDSVKEFYLFLGHSEGSY